MCGVTCVGYTCGQALVGAFTWVVYIGYATDMLLDEHVAYAICSKVQGAWRCLCLGARHATQCVPDSQGIQYCTIPVNEAHPSFTFGSSRARCLDDLTIDLVSDELLRSSSDRNSYSVHVARARTSELVSNDI